MSTQKMGCDARIQDMDKYWSGDDIWLPANQTYTLVITYPFEAPGEFPIKTGQDGIGLGKLLNIIGKSYIAQYENGVPWGHSIGDLVLVGIVVNHDKKRITLSVDS